MSSTPPDYSPAASYRDVYLSSLPADTSSDEVLALQCQEDEVEALCRQQRGTGTRLLPAGPPSLHPPPPPPSPLAALAARPPPPPLAGPAAGQPPEVDSETSSDTSVLRRLASILPVAVGGPAASPAHAPCPLPFAEAPPAPPP
jgi:hypothetical protein